MSSAYFRVTKMLFRMICRPVRPHILNPSHTVNTHCVYCELHCTKMRCLPFSLHHNTPYFRLNWGTFWYSIWHQSYCVQSLCSATKLIYTTWCLEIQMNTLLAYVYSGHFGESYFDFSGLIPHYFLKSIPQKRHAI